VQRHSSMSAEELIRACAELNDGEAWSEFVSRFHRAISLSIIRIAYKWGHAPQQVVDDLIQETYLKLCSDRCRLLLEFAVRRPEAIAGYVKTIAMNVGHDYFKALHSQKRGSGEIEQSIEENDPKASGSELGGQDAIERAVLLKQINEYLETCSEGPDQGRDRLVFWLYYQQGMSAKAISSLPTVGLTAKGVESAISRLTRRIREHVADIQSERSTDPLRGEKGFRRAESY
jgi:RNA polymerase sigma-70 factor, ECF subfamily